MKMFLTFGQAHTHYVEGRNFDKDTVAVVYGKDELECDEIAFRLFDGRFHQHLLERLWDHDYMMQYFPKGYVPVNPPIEVLLHDAHVISAYTANYGQR